MFKRAILLTSVLFGILAFAPLPVTAQDDAVETEETSKPKKKKKKDKKQASPVAKAAKRVKKVKGRVNDKADYYIFLHSASWCGPCRQEMPSIVEKYKDIKKSKQVDVILFCHDRSVPDAKAFVKNFKIPFYTVMDSDDKAADVPGHTSPQGIPFCAVVDRYGRLITSGHPAQIIANWQSHTIEKGEPIDPKAAKEE